MKNPAYDDPATRIKANFDHLCEALGLRTLAYSLALHDILKKLYNLHDVSAADCDFLASHHYYAILAIHAEKQFERDNWRGHLNEASAWWRKADQPMAALQRARRSIQSNNRDIRAFGYTTGAAAFLDCEDFQQAEEWARKAIDQNSRDPHPYNVMGRLHRKRGNLVQSERFFQLAKTLESN